jgi:PIN domain nuclease of toxin-antitoxin system
MRLLFDTHLLLWTAAFPDKVPQEILERMDDPANELFFSVVAIWETAIKFSRGRSDFDVEPGFLRRELLQHGFWELPIAGEHAAFVSRLPSIHKDPFDRILIAQATVEGITLLTSDAMVARYPGPIQLI